MVYRATAAILQALSLLMAIGLVAPEARGQRMTGYLCVFVLFIGGMLLHFCAGVLEHLEILTWDKAQASGAKVPMKDTRIGVPPAARTARSTMTPAPAMSDRDIQAALDPPVSKPKRTSLDGTNLNDPLAD